MDLSDLAVIIVAYNSAAYIGACLESVLDHLGAMGADIIVMDAGPPDGTEEIVRGFPGVRLLHCRNGGFAYANNRALMTCDTRYVLFLNPDTKIVDGSLSEMVARMDERPDVGLAGVRQLNTRGEVDRTIRRFPNALRCLGDAFRVERIPGRPGWLGERVLDPAAYETETDCDWTSGSFMLARREAIESAGFIDERFFMYSEETDWCHRIKAAGWRVCHFPWMTIVHYGSGVEGTPTTESMSAYSRMLYARKHFAPLHRLVYFASLLTRYAVRSVGAPSNRRAASRVAIRTMFGRTPPPNWPWSTVSVNPREATATISRARVGAP